MPHRTAVAAALTALCACELSGPWTEGTARDVAPAVLFVRQPAAEVAAALPGPGLLAPPAAAPADGSEARPFPTLSAALRQAPAGALLRIGEGIWRERLDIARPVVLMGRGAGRTRIVPPEGTDVAVDVHGADHVQFYGLSIEDAVTALRFTGGAGHRLENVELRGLRDSAILARGAELVVSSVSVSAVGGGQTGRGFEFIGGSLDARRLTMRGAGRRAVYLQGARATLEDLDVSDSAVAAVQALDGADVRVVRGEFSGQGGAALYAGAARLSVEGARVRNDEYGIIAARGSLLTAVGNEVTDYRVAGVALVNAHGTVQRTIIARGGTEAGVSITFADGEAPVLLVDNRIQDPGTMGVHITNSTVTARGNTVTGARPDREKDMGDGFFAIESKLVLEQNVMRGNAGSGVAILRTSMEADHNGFIGNGRAGLLLLDRSRGTATGNFFQRNALAAVEVGERAHATLVKNRFEGNPRLDIETGCGKGAFGTADVQYGNTFAAPMRRDCGR